MKIKNLPLLLFFIFATNLPQASLAQRESREKIIVKYLYNIATTIEWPNHQKLDTFKILLIGSKDRKLIKELKKLSASSEMKGLRIQLLKQDNIKLLPSSQIIIVSKLKNDLIEQLSIKIDHSQTLLITDSYANQRLVMINFTEKGKKLNFEYNKANIINQGLKPGPKLVLFKGTEIDVAQLYREGQASLVLFQQKLRVQEEKLRVQNTQLKILKDNISQSLKEIAHQNKTISQQKGNILNQEKMLTEQITKLELQQKQFAQVKIEINNSKAKLKVQSRANTHLQRELQGLTKNLSLQKLEVTKQKKELAQQEVKLEVQQQKQISLKDEINEKTLFISQQVKKTKLQEQNILRQARDIKLQQLEIQKRKQQVIDIRNSISTNVTVLKEQKEQIAKQKKTMLAQGATIDSQKTTLKLLWGIVALVSGFIFTLYNAYRYKKKSNIQLQEQQLALQRTLGELHTTQKQLIVAKDDALQASQSKSRFLANMSHEIRTPMNAILGFTELLKGRLTEKKNKSFLESIDISGRSLLRLINDILDLSKVEAGKFELEYTAVNPHNLFKEIHSIFSRKISQKGLNFIMDVDKKLHKALILDETRLRQILFNLIGNAIKFTKEGYVKLSVHHQENIKDQSHLTLCFSIEDTGVGIPLKNREQIFEAFEQQKGQSHAEFGGTGLGLAISKRLAQLMNGDITIIDGSEGGVIFQVTLNDIEVAVNAPDAIDTEKPTDIISFDHAKILIVDDVPLNRELLANYLAGYSFTIMLAENGLECVTLVKKNPPDLILMDMKMPVMDGFEATAIIKGNDATKHIPIIAVTASAMKQSEEEIRNVCDSYLRKPLSRMGLIQEISHFLKHTKASSILPGNKAESAPRKQHSSVILQKLQDMVLPNVLKYLDNPGTSELNDVIITLIKLPPEEYSEAHALAQELEEALDNFDIEYIESTLKKLKEDIS